MLDVIVNNDLNLRLLEDWHAKELFALIEKNRDYLKQYFDWLDQVKSSADVKELISDSVKHTDKNSGFDTGIWVDKKLAGVIGFNKIDWDNYSAQLSFWLDPDLQKQGIMSKSAIELIKYAFEDLNLNKVELNCSKDNQAAIALAQKLGMQENSQNATDSIINYEISA